MTINDNRGGRRCNFALVIERRDNRVQITEYNYLRGARTAWVKLPDDALPLFIGEGDHEVVMGC